MQTSLLKELKTTDVQIRNKTSLDGSETLSITIRKKGVQRNDEDCSAFLCKLKAVVTKENESEDNNDFLISVEVMALLKYEIPNIPFEEIQDLALQEIFPHLRAIISSVTAAVGMHSILVPLHI